MLPHNHTFEAIGTTWEITTSQLIPSGLLTNIHTTIDEFDKTYSRFRQNSLVSQIAKQAGEYVFPEGASSLISFYKELYDLTDGRVTPLIGDMLVRAGYDAEYSFKTRPQKDLLSWDEAMKWDNNILHTEMPVTLDVGAAGKGRLVDMIAGLLDEAKLEEYVIDASGDLLHKGSSHNRVGLEHPRKPGTIIGIVDVQNQSLCASADNRRTWGNGLHHIFDPETKRPVRDIIATWVMTDEAMIADGLATALFFVGPTVLAETYTFQYIRMHADGSLDYSHDFGGELF